MKRYKFEIEFTEEDLLKDEFFEEVQAAGAGGAEILRNDIADILDEHIMFSVEAKSLITVKSYTDE